MYDVIIIGAGPAGSSTARFAAKSGLKTVILDKESFLRDKPCGGALSQRTVDLLGSKAKKSINVDVSGIYTWSPSFLSVRIPLKSGHFILRTSFDSALLRDAQVAGAEVFENTRATKVHLGTDHVEVHSSHQSFQSRYVVLADGVHSRFARQLGIRGRWPINDMAITVFSETPYDDDAITAQLGTEERFLHLFFGIVPKGYGWFFPKRGFVNIGIGSSLGIKNATKVYQRFVSHLKELGLLPSQGLTLQASKGYLIPFGHPLPMTFNKKTLVVGDAAGFVSPLTGEGLYYGITSGKLAAETLDAALTEECDLAIYQTKWMASFGNDLIKYGYPLREMIYKTTARMERIVKMIAADKKLARATAQAIMGDITYKETKQKLIRRGLIAAPKSLFVRSVREK